MDGDLTTSEGIFVYDGGSGNGVRLSGRVRVIGQVHELDGLAELVGPSRVNVLANGVALPTPASISLPLANIDALERHEGIRVQFRQTLIANKVCDLGHYDRALLSSGDHQMTPTNVVTLDEQAEVM